MCMYVCICLLYVYIYIHIFIYIHTYIHACTLGYIHRYESYDNSMFKDFSSMHQDKTLLHICVCYKGCFVRRVFCYVAKNSLVRSLAHLRSSSEDRLLLRHERMSRASKWSQPQQKGFSWVWCVSFGGIGPGPGVDIVFGGFRGGSL